VKRAVHAFHDEAGRTRAIAHAKGDDLDDSVVAEREVGARFPPAPEPHTHTRTIEDAGGKRERP